MEAIILANQVPLPQGSSLPHGITTTLHLWLLLSLDAGTVKTLP